MCYRHILVIKTRRGRREIDRHADSVNRNCRTKY